jgi:hypothetical protein
MGWNFPSSEFGGRILREVVSLVIARKITPVVGQVVGFEDIPAAIAAMRAHTPWACRRTHEQVENPLLRLCGSAAAVRVLGGQLLNSAKAAP